MTTAKQTEAAKTAETKPALNAKKASAFAAYLLIAMPYNMAMAADWQSPSQLAALNNGGAQQGSSITITSTPIAQKAYFQITYEDVATEVATQLTQQGVEKKARATTRPAGTPVLYSADHPLKLVLHGLQVDPSTRQWQAQAHIMAQGRTEAVKPIAGHYDGVATVPVLTRQLRSGDLIEEADLGTRDIPTRNLRKDTIVNAVDLIGKSPRSTISGQRPVRLSEVSAPVIIRKGELVDLSYTTPFMFIKTAGIALEDGEQGGLIRVKNDKTQKSMTGRAVSAGKVEINPQQGS